MREKQADAHIYTRNSKEMASVEEDRLHAAGILYQVISEPLWVANGWLTTLRIDAAGAASRLSMVTQPVPRGVCAG